MLINVLSVVVGLIGTIALSGTMSFTGEKTSYTNSLNAFLLVLFAILILRYVYLHLFLKDKKGILCSGAYSLGLAFALTVGKQLHTVENFAIDNPLLWLQMLVLLVFFFGPVLYVLQWIKEKMNKNCNVVVSDESGNTTFVSGNKHFCGKSFLLTWIVIFLCWIPVFLAFYPGAFVYDAMMEHVQVEMREFTTHHPLSHVLLLGGFVSLGNKLFGSYNIGIAMYTIFQMFVLSGVFAYTVSYLRRYLTKGICMGITLFYGLFPVIPMYAVCSAKDTLFNGAFLLMLIQLLKLLETAFSQKEAEKKRAEKIGDVVLFVLASAGAMLLRNNGVLAYGALFLIVAITAVMRVKQNPFWMRLGVMMFLALLLYVGTDKTLALVLNADDSGKQEPLTVPIQQLARTYRYSPEVFSKEERELLYAYLPQERLEEYDADLSDPVKAYFNSEKYSEKPAEFTSLWIRMFTKKPATYLNAWMMTSYGYWYPDTVINVYGGQERFTFQYEQSSYFGFETEPPGERDSKFPWLEEQYRKMSLELYQQNIPGVSMLFSPGFLFWIFFGCLLSCIYQKKYLSLLPMVSILLLWGTVIPGPTFLVRYVLILWFALPLILSAGAGRIVNKI